MQQGVSVPNVGDPRKLIELATDAERAGWDGFFVWVRRYLQAEREALLWKLHGLGERAVRMPRTPTGTSLVGIVKHCANVEIVWEFADRTIVDLPLDAVGHVPWWPGPREVTLHHILVRVTDDLARHAGQADILREQTDSAVGQSAAHSKIPDDVDWPEYVGKLKAIAEQFPE